MERLSITWENMDDYSSFPLEYRFVDSADIIPGIEGWGRKVVSTQDWYFQIHFPGNPVMPGVLVMETLQQTGILIIGTLSNNDEKDMCLTGCKNMRMYNSVRPGDVLNTHVIVEDYNHEGACFRGEVKISRYGEKKDLLACSMKFSMKKKSIVRLNNIITHTELPAINSDEATVYDYSNIDEYLADPQEYRFIDKAMVLSDTGVAWKNSSSLDWYYKYDNSMMPVGFIMESIMQTGVLIVTQSEKIGNPLMMFNDCSMLEMHSFVSPGDELRTYVTLQSFRNGIAKYSGNAVVEDGLVCNISFTLIHPEEIRKFSERLAERSVSASA